MELNLDKNKVMTMGGTRQLEVALDGQELEQVEAYLCAAGQFNALR